MLNFEFRMAGKRCCRSDRPLLPGEEFFSALVEKQGETVRLDFAAENWQGPPEECVGWWKSSVPKSEKGRVYWAPREVMLAYFEHVRQQTDQADIAYLLALLLAQKRILTTKESLDSPNPNVLYLENKRDRCSYEVPVVPVSASRIEEIQNELSNKLFTNQPETDHPDPEMT